MSADHWPTIRVSGGWESLLEENTRADLERTALPRYLLAQRWFGSKSHKLETLVIRDWLPVIEAPLTGFFVLVEARYCDGRLDVHDIPMAIAAGGEADALLRSNPKSVIATLKGPLGGATLYDATASDRFCTTLFDRIAQGGKDQAASTKLQSLRTSAFPVTASADGLEPVARGSEEQSNTTIVFNNRYLLKIFRKLETGLNPDFEIGRFLTEKTTFERTPKTFGALQCQTRTGMTVTLALLQEFIPNSVQAWEWMLGILHTLFEEPGCETNFNQRWETHESLDLIAISEHEPPATAIEIIGSSLQAAALLGKRTAELHLALASDPNDADFAIEALTPDEYRKQLDKLGDESAEVFQGLREKLATFEPSLQPLVATVLEAGPRMVKAVLEAPIGDEPMVKIRCHGDYHLGQVLRVANDFVILDFEGEPGRSIEERRAKQSPWKDVAGMLRSFDYAAQSESIKVAGGDESAYAQLEPLARFWSVWTSAAFLKAYRQTAAEGRLDLGSRTAASTTLRRFMIEKLLFELRYEANYRPSWVRLPLLGLAQLAQ